MSDDSKYKPDPEDIAALSKPAIMMNDHRTREHPVVIPEITGLIVNPNTELQHIEIQPNNVKQAADIVLKQIKTMVAVVDDLKLLAIASQSSYMFETIGKLSKEIINGAKILAELDEPATPENPNSKRPIVNNLNLSVTSDQIIDLVSKQMSRDPKKYKNGKK